MQLLSISKIALVNIAITLALLESAGLGVFFARHGGFFYGSGKATPSVDAVTVTSNNDIGKDADTTQILDPYFGYIFRPSLPVTRVATITRQKEMLHGALSTRPEWLDLSANNFGFFSEVDYPYKKRRDEFIVGIFGGSFAQWFSLQSGKKLATLLESFPAIHGKEVRVLNFAQAGFKQPQQVQVLSYFQSTGQRFDLVVNIDGHNEVAISWMNLDRNIDASMPGAQFILPLHKLISKTELDFESLQLMYRENELELREARYRKLFESSTSAAVAVFAETLSDKAKRERSFILKKIDERLTLNKRASSNFVNVAGHGLRLEGEEKSEFVMDLWRNSAVTMQRLCDAVRIPYLEVIQPNQYYSNKEFSDEERKIAISAESRYKAVVEATYPRLEEFQEELKGKGVNIVSAIGIFDSNISKIYADTCCHINQVGNDILADFVAEEIGKIYANRKTAWEDRSASPVIPPADR